MRREAEPYPMRMIVPEDTAEQSEAEEKIWGECITCGEETDLVARVGLCDPCCFGEVSIRGENW